MATHARGLICLCLDAGAVRRARACAQMTDQNETPFGTAFTVSIEARDGVSTGISAHDRAHTIQVAIDPAPAPRDLVQPGHVFPLRARAGGVLQRSGQTEAAVDLARLAGLAPAGVVCEMMNDDGTMARVPDLDPVRRAARAANDHGRRPDRVPAPHGAARRARRLDVRLPTDYGRVPGASPTDESIDGKQHVALVKGDVDGAEDVLVRVHSECLTGDVFHSRAATAASSSSGARADRARRAAASLLYLAPGGPRHRPAQQAQGVRAPGERARHRRGERAARLPGRRAGVRHRVPDPRRPRPDDDPRAHEQPQEDRRHQRLRPHSRLAGADRGRSPARRTGAIWRRSATSSATPSRAACITRACASSRPPSRSGKRRCRTCPALARFTLRGCYEPRPIETSSASRSISRFRIFPVGPLGSCSTRTTCRGYLYAATRARIHSRMSSGSGRVPGRGDDECGDLLAEPGVGHADHRRLEHVRVLVQRLLHLARVHVVAAADDHLLLAVDEKQVAVVVDVADVAGGEPAVRGERAVASSSSQ